MKILLTGGNGFLGRWVFAALKQDHHVVVSPMRERHDLTIHADTVRAFKESQPDCVVHLAAIVGGIGANKARPADFFRENMQMALNVVDVARHYKAKVVSVGTVCSYPKHCAVPFKETDLWNGYPEETNAPYGIAKKAMLTMMQAYHAQYGLKMVYLIPANLYGPGDHDDLETSHVIPALIRKMMTAKARKQKTVTLWGTGNATREFLYVGDAAEAIMLAVAVHDHAEPVNLGTGVEITIAALAERVKAAVGYEGTIQYDATKPDGQPRRSLDTTRARALLGWTARTSLEEGLRSTVESMVTKADTARYEL